jgi:hypothetical protein
LVWAVDRVNSRPRRELTIRWLAAGFFLTRATATPGNSDSDHRFDRSAQDIGQVGIAQPRAYAPRPETAGGNA